ncbi:MAG: hypothetical protein KF688_07785 [Pirellulales bacterium]|nr:hypothetical protein [Pirellulales bacterium]
MRVRAIAVLCAVCSPMFVAGCSKSGDNGPVASGGSASTTATASSDATAAPVAVVQQFLDAVKRGDTTRAAGMLTPLALKMTTENDLSFSPPGSETAQFEILGAEMVDADKAVVETVWSDLDADGQRAEEMIAWALRLEGGQWRVSGMAADLEENEAPLVIDFENPLELVERPAQQAAPQTPGGTAPTPTNPGDQVARDPFQQPQTR